MREKEKEDKVRERKRGREREGAFQERLNVGHVDNVLAP